eukprot:gene5989-5860_t
MTLLKFSDVSLAFGAMPLLDKVSWQIARGERVCIIGRNGTGKSSMMKLVKGDQKPDDGSVWRAPGLKIGELPQELPVADERTVFDVVAEGLDGVGALLAEYHHLSQNCVTEADLDKLMHVQHDLEARDGWRLQTLVDSTLKATLAAEETANALFDKKLAQEEVWIRQGIKARRTRNEGRVRALKALRVERSERRERTGKANIQLDTADKSGKQVMVLENVSFHHPDGPFLIKDFSMVLQRGDRIGLLGVNGAGKSTLIKTIAGELSPLTGDATMGKGLNIGYF